MSGLISRNKFENIYLVNTLTQKKGIYNVRWIWILSSKIDNKTSTFWLWRRQNICRNIVTLRRIILSSNFKVKEMRMIFTLFDSHRFWNIDVRYESITHKIFHLSDFQRFSLPQFTSKQFSYWQFSMIYFA